METLRAETPPPRNRKVCDDWTSSPVSRPELSQTEHIKICDTGALLVAAKPVADDYPRTPNPEVAKGYLTPTIDKDNRCLSPQRTIAHTPSPQKQGMGKENRLRGSCTHTPSRLPTVQEHDGLLPVSDCYPAWAMRTPTQTKELGEAMHKIGLISSPSPPGLQDVGRLSPPPVKNTFIQFESPTRTTGLKSPKSVPPYFAPGLTISDAALPFPTWESPNQWGTDAQVPEFPSVSAPPVQGWALKFDSVSDDYPVDPPRETFDPVLAAHQSSSQALDLWSICNSFIPEPPYPAVPDSAPLPEKPKPQKGTPVRIADFLPEAPPAPAPTRGTPVRLSDFMPDISQIASLGAQHGFDSMQRFLSQALSPQGPDLAPPFAPPFDGTFNSFGVPPNPWTSPQAPFNDCSGPAPTQMRAQALPFSPVPPQQMPMPFQQPPVQLPLQQTPSAPISLDAQLAPQHYPYPTPLDQVQYHQPLQHLQQHYQQPISPQTQNPPITGQTQFPQVQHKATGSWQPPTLPPAHSVS
jgi:hypothetical protein